MGEVKQRLCEASSKLAADFLVMGSHGHSFFKRYVPAIKFVGCTKSLFFLAIRVKGQINLRVVGGFQQKRL